MDNIKNPLREFFILLIRRFYILLITLAIAHSALAFPVLPSQFYGEVWIDGKYADIGTNISVYDVGGILCGSFTIEKKGEYIISCKGDNPKTIKDEGAKENEGVVFYVDNKNIKTKVEWHEGSFTRLNLVTMTENETMASSLEYPSEERIPVDTYLIICLFLLIIVFVIIRIKKEEKWR